MNDTIMHVPYYQRHIVSPPRIHRVENNTIYAEANYVVVRSRDDTFSEVFNTGRYLDVLVKAGETLKIKERVCVFDGDLVPNSIVYPL
jgi:salicylate 5-hydroxylase small subunit